MNTHMHIWIVANFFINTDLFLNFLLNGQIYKIDFAFVVGLKCTVLLFTISILDVILSLQLVQSFTKKNQSCVVGKMLLFRLDQVKGRVCGPAGPKSYICVIL